MNLDSVIENAKRMMIEEGMRAAFVALSLELPFLNFPIVKQVTQFMMKKVIEAALTKGENAAFNLYIEKITKGQAEDFKKAVAKKEAALTDEERRKYEQAQIDAFKRLTKLSA